MTTSASTLDDLLRMVLDRLLKKGSRVHASRGWNKELVGVTLKLTNPRARLSHTEKKGTVFSGLGELLWYLSRSRASKFISYYIEEYADNAERDGSLHGAYGPRLFGKERNQVKRIVSMLQQRETTRKAVVQLFDAADLDRTYRDVPCTCALQFLVRSGHLAMIAMMRSNDAYLGMPHDVFTFTMLQEIVARELGYEIGEYTHFASSLHLYERHFDKAKKYLAEGWQSTEHVAMPPMPLGDPWPSVQTLLRAEAAIRGGRVPAAQVWCLDPYWQDLARLLQVFRHFRKKEHRKIAAIRRKMVYPIYNEYIKKKEIHRLTAPRSGQRELFHDEDLESEDDSEVR
jgi:thymidylate synthase